MRTRTTLNALAIVCLLSIQSLFAQNPTFEWANKMGGVLTDIPRSIAVDASGNVYSTGYFQGTVDFDPGAGTTNLISAGLRDIYIQKLDANGNLLWVKQIEATLNCNGYGITVDASGNVFTTGNFEGTADFDPGAGAANLTSVGGYDVFIQKLDVNGNFLWVKQIGGNSTDSSVSIALDASGNIFTSGKFKETVDFDPGVGVLNLTSLGGFDLFIQKLDANGDFLWAKRMGGTSHDLNEGMAIDASGNVLTTGFFSYTADFDPGVGTANLTSAGLRDIYIQKMDANGNFLWAKQIGGTAYDAGTSITVDASGNVFTTGIFQDTVEFDPGIGTAILISPGSYDSYVQKLDANGNFLWVKQMTGTSGVYSYAIALDVSGNIYTTGSFKLTADFDPGAGTANLTSLGVSNSFVLKLDANGDFIWVGHIAGTSSLTAYSMVVDDFSNIYTTGPFQGSVDFDPGTGTANLTNVGNNDIFVLKLSQCNPTTHTPDVASLPDVTGQCSVAIPTAPTANNGCGTTFIGTTTTTFPIMAQGTTTVTWIYDDGNGNTSTQTQDVVITDATAPL
ncbi:MAG: SBBP repeat-containing protein, partial [Flavobacteriales bacterium]|nr:SBBP repeat-containing protein [Flavobacteriales bacterium]